MGLADVTRRASTAPPVAAQRPLRVLVVAHVYYPELWPELARCIDRVRQPRQVALTLAEGPADRLIDVVTHQFPDAAVRTTPNLGRDQLPLLQLLRDGLLDEDVDLILKLHTKASRHRLDGRRWRRRMLDSLCGSDETVDGILRLFGADPGLGVVAPAGGLMGREFWGANSELVDDLAARLAVPVELEQTFFPGGSMYWARASIVRELGELALDSSDFAPEPLPSDGTLAHALERLVGVIANAQGLDVIAADEVPGRLADVRSAQAPEEPDER